MKKEQQIYPTILQAVGITAMVILFLNIFSFLLFNILPNLPRNLLFLLGYLLAMGTIIWIITNLRKEDTMLFPFLIKVENIQAILLILIATIALNTGIMYPLSALIPVSDWTKEILIANFGTVDIYMVLAAVISAPIFEELIFRGFMMNGLLKNYSPAVAILVSSLLFGIMHLNPIQLVTAIIGGLFIGWVFYKSKNLFYCIWIHFIINAIGCYCIHQFGIRPFLEEGIPYLYGSLGNAMVYIGVSILIFIGILFKLNQLFEKEKIA